MTGRARDAVRWATASEKACVGAHPSQAMSGVAPGAVPMCEGGRRRTAVLLMARRCSVCGPRCRAKGRCSPSSAVCASSANSTGASATGSRLCRSPYAHGHQALRGYRLDFERERVPETPSSCSGAPLCTSTVRRYSAQQGAAGDEGKGEARRTRIPRAGMRVGASGWGTGAGRKCCTAG